VEASAEAVVVFLVVAELWRMPEGPRGCSRRGPE